ncbi:MAG: transposase [Egibacteraceae bacterium]
MPTDVTAVAVALKELEGLSDRQAATALETDVRWRAAAGSAPDEKAFDASVLATGGNG